MGLLSGISFKPAGPAAGGGQEEEEKGVEAGARAGAGAAERSPAKVVHGVRMMGEGLRGEFVPNSAAGWQRPQPSSTSTSRSSNSRAVGVGEKRSLPVGRGLKDEQVVKRFASKVRSALSSTTSSSALGEREQKAVEEPAAPSSTLSKDPNVLAAQAFKARARGDLALYDELQQRAQKLRRSRAAGGEAEVVSMLPSEMRAQALGRQEVQLESSDMRMSASRRGKLKVNRRDRDAEHEELNDFLRREMVEGPGDMDEAFAKNVLKMGTRYTAKNGGEAGNGGSLLDEDAPIDTRMFESREERMTEQAAADHRRRLALAEHKRVSAMERSCHLCIGSVRFKQDMVPYVSSNALLYVVPNALAEGHCILAPAAHVASTTACDEAVWEELEELKACLRRMGEAMGKKMIFMETARYSSGASNGKFSHAAVEVIPVSASVAADAPLYFKQALDDVGDEWAAHRKVISLKPGQKSIRNAVPKGFAYFSVEWEAGGYARVIEEGHFPKKFGIDVIAGIMRKHPRETIKQSAARFEELWKDHKPASQPTLT
jgi:diadenosine tetraphosphate (Ap4A) HIT family hydrolase